MDIYSLKLFLDAAKTLNFTRVAEAFYTTQPAVSRRISDLEEELGYKLFCREHHGVSLTKEGELLLPFVQESMDTLHLGITTVNNFVNVRKRSITVGSMTPMTSTFLPALIDEFTQKNPETKFEIFRMFSRQIRESLSGGEVRDIYIGEASDMDVDDSWEKIIIKSNPLGLIVRKREELDSASKIKKFILNHSAFMLPEEDASAMTKLSKRMLVSYGVNASSWLEISPIETIMFYIASGIGYAFLPENEFLLKAFDLKFIPLDTCEQLKMAIAYRKDAPSRVHAFSDLVVEYMLSKGV